jgi:hypothetical protein
MKEQLFLSIFFQEHLFWRPQPFPKLRVIERVSTYQLVPIVSVHRSLWYGDHRDGWSSRNAKILSSYESQYQINPPIYLHLDGFP